MYLWLNAAIEEQCPLSEEAKVIYCVDLSAKLGRTAGTTPLRCIDSINVHGVDGSKNLILKFAYFSKCANWD